MRSPIYYIQKAPLYFVMVTLLIISFFFFIGAEKKRADFSKSDLDSFSDSMLVTISGVVD